MTILSGKSVFIRLSVIQLACKLVVVMEGDAKAA
jgi:hypothetical protein